MKYELNPHKHVKIWLSTKPDVFMNQINQLRLIKMCVTNRNDNIYLVYAESLLSPNAQAELKKFCWKHEIIPKSLEQDVLPYCEGPEETNLMAIVQQEIHALGRGGNVASASDVMRWLKPIYSLGIYSDFDVKVNTKNLPDVIVVDAPIITAIGSTLLPIDKFEAISLNNEVLAVVGDDAKALEQIKSIQRAIHEVYQDNKHYLDYGKRLVRDMNIAFLGPVVSKNFNAPKINQIIQQMPEFQAAAMLASHQKSTPIELREQIANGVFTQALNLGQYLSQFREMHQKVINDPNTHPKLRSQYEQMATMTDKEYIAKLESDFNHRLLSVSVTHSTGPVAIAMGLFDDAALPSNKLDQIKPYALSSYGLDEAFHSENRNGFHTDENDPKVQDKIHGEMGSLGDAAWTPSGADALEKKENQMNNAAHQMQQSFKKHLKPNHEPLIKANDVFIEFKEIAVETIRLSKISPPNTSPGKSPLKP